MQPLEAAHNKVTAHTQQPAAGPLLTKARAAATAAMLLQLLRRRQRLRQQQLLRNACHTGQRPASRGGGAQSGTACRRCLFLFQL